MQIISSIKDINKKRNLAMRLFFLKCRLNINRLLKKREFDLNTINSILLWTGKGLGDCILVSGFINTLRSTGYKVTVLSDEKNKFIFDKLIKVDNVVVTGKRKSKIGQYDLLIDLNDYSHNIASGIRFLIKSKAKYSIGFNTSLYDLNIDYTEYKSHFSARFKYVLDILNINHQSSTAPVIHNNSESENAIRDWLKENLSSKKIVAFCPFASKDVRSLSLKQCDAILRYFYDNEEYQVVLLGSCRQISTLPDKFSQMYTVEPFNSLSSAIAVIKQSDFVISVDTLFVHISRIYNKKLFSIYNNRMIDNVFENNHVFSPGYNNAIQLFTDECSNTSLGDDVSSFDVNKLISAIEDYHINKTKFFEKENI